MKKILNIRLGFFTLATVLVSGMLIQSYANAANTIPGNNVLVSVNNVDGQGMNSGSGPAGISSNGNVILFSTNASNITDYNGVSGLYVRDIEQSTTERVDVSTSGVLADNTNLSSALSETGRYVAFSSMATNLIDGTTSRAGGVYIRDTQLGTTTQVAIGYYPTNGHDWDKVWGISNDGRFLVYTTKDFGPGPWKPYVIRYVDTLTGNSKTFGGPTQSTKWTTHASMSCDGSLVVFSSSYNPSTGGDENHKVYLADMRNVDNPTFTTIGGSYTFAPKISCNGNYITYNVQNSYNDPTPKPTGLSNYAHLIRYNRIDGTRAYIDSNTAGTVFDNNTFLFDDYATASGGIWNDDRFYNSIADTGDITLKYNGQGYLKHLSDNSGTMETIQRTPSGTYLGSPVGRLSANGRFVTYSSPQGYDLGLLSSSSTFYNVFRSETGI